MPEYSISRICEMSRNDLRRYMREAPALTSTDLIYGVILLAHKNVTERSYPGQPLESLLLTRPLEEQSSRFTFSVLETHPDYICTDGLIDIDILRGSRATLIRPHHGDCIFYVSNTAQMSYERSINLKVCTIDTLPRPTPNQLAPTIHNIEWNPIPVMSFTPVDPVVFWVDDAVPTPPNVGANTLINDFNQGGGPQGPAG